jgi:uncharacterized membrane protein YfcA
MEIFQLFILGLVIGFMSSFFGIGGGSLIVPVLYTLYPKLPAAIVIPISLGSIFVVTLINTFKFAKKKLLPPKNIIITFLITCSIGGLLGTQVLYLIDTAMAKKAMGIILIFMVVKLLVFKTKDHPIESFKPSKGLLGTTGFLGAFISSITGLGGGIIFTPIFINIIKVPLKLVSPYSNMAMVVATFIGVVPHIFIQNSEKYFNNEIMNMGLVGNVNFTFISIIAFGAFFSSSLGVKYNGLVKPRTKKALLVLLLLIFSVKLLFF